MIKIAVIGTGGVPAKYGGFETFVENIIGAKISSNIEYTIFCSSKAYKERKDSYKNAQLKYVGLKANGVQSTFYDIVSMLKTTNKYDVALVLGISGCIFLPVFRIYFRNKLIVNIDGLEHRREKWGRFARWFLRQSETMAVRYADVLIADNKGIQDYVTETYHKESILIAYGGDHVLRKLSEDTQQHILSSFGLPNTDYAISICRIEPENNCHMILEAFSKTDKLLIFIGNWDRSEYGSKLKRKYSNYPNIIIHDSEYDIDLLYALRAHASMYIHGHSAGGTNPSLVEAMFFGKPIIAFDCVYNRATTGNKAFYFKDSSELTSLVNKKNLSGETMVEMAYERYTWKKIATQYESLYKTTAPG